MSTDVSFSVPAAVPRSGNACLKLSPHMHPRQPFRVSPLHALHLQMHGLKKGETWLPVRGCGWATFCAAGGEL